MCTPAYPAEHLASRLTLGAVILSMWDSSRTSSIMYSLHLPGGDIQVWGWVRIPARSMPPCPAEHLAGGLQAGSHNPEARVCLPLRALSLNVTCSAELSGWHSFQPELGSMRPMALGKCCVRLVAFLPCRASGWQPSSWSLKTMSRSERELSLRRLVREPAPRRRCG